MATGTTTSVAATSTLVVARPIEGGASNSTTSHALAPSSASRSRRARCGSPAARVGNSAISFHDGTTCSPSTAVSRTTSASPTPGSVSRWKTLGCASRASMPRHFAACPWVSRSTSSTRRRFFCASQAATFTASVVLPVPPFSLMKAMRRAIGYFLSASWSTLLSICPRSFSSSSIFSRRVSMSAVDGRFIADSAERIDLSSTPFAESVRATIVCTVETNFSFDRSCCAILPMRSSPVATSFFITGLSLSMAADGDLRAAPCQCEARVIRELADKRLVVVTGKGGVGKTTLAAALALQSAREGKKTLVCEVNARERISTLLGKAEVGPEVKSVEENLWAVNLRPDEAMREYALMILRFESIYNAVFENRLVRYFLRFIPSLQELVLLGKILFHLREKKPDGSWRFDRIVVDAPATGHAITFLSVPQVILDTVPPGALANDATWMRDALVDPATTAAVLVTLPEELPVMETLELYGALRERVKVTPQLVVLNAFIAPRFELPGLPAELPPGLREVARVHEVRAARSAEFRERLAALRLPVLTVPRLYSPAFGRGAVETIADCLAGEATP